ncbi:TPA: hypothetical protein LA462_001042 [Clostridium botulinum]|nr:hypothetical protein [Clostridium botulinum]
MAYIRKHLREGLKVLGNTYSIKRIDFEDCLYKDLGNGIDFEISHCREGYCVFVWMYKPYLKMIRSVPQDSYMSPILLSELKGTLDKLENEFMHFEEAFKKYNKLF